MIFHCAFSVEAVGGVVRYIIKEAFRNGVARGIFSKDAGNSAAAGMHAAAVIPLNVLWNMVNLVAALIVFLNVIALCFMLNYVRYVFQDYIPPAEKRDCSVDFTRLDLSKPVDEQEVK